MTALRTIASALLLVVGTVFIALWAVLQALMPVVEDGTAVRKVAERALKSPALVESVSAELEGYVDGALADSGIDLERFGVETETDELIAQVVDSATVQNALLKELDDAHGQVSAQLTQPERVPAPLTLSLDLNDTVNAQVANLGVIGRVIGEVNMDPLNVEVLEAAQFEQVRDTYAALETVHTWGLWVGLAVLALGALASGRRRWLFVKELLVLGVVLWAVGGAIAVWGPELFAWLLPGEYDGAFANVWVEAVGAEVAPPVMHQSFILGALAIAAALIVLAIRTALTRRRG